MQCRGGRHPAGLGTGNGWQGRWIGIEDTVSAKGDTRDSERRTTKGRVPMADGVIASAREESGGMGTRAGRRKTGARTGRGGTWFGIHLWMIRKTRRIGAVQLS